VPTANLLQNGWDFLMDAKKSCQSLQFANLFIALCNIIFSHFAKQIKKIAIFSHFEIGMSVALSICKKVLS